jgi:hypothetical protein
VSPNIAAASGQATNRTLSESGTKGGDGPWACWLTFWLRRDLGRPCAVLAIFGRRKLSLRLRICTNVRRYFQPPTFLHRVRAAGLPAIFAGLPHADASPRLGVDLDAHAATVLDAGRDIAPPHPLHLPRLTVTQGASRKTLWGQENTVRSRVYNFTGAP